MNAPGYRLPLRQLDFYLGRAEPIPQDVIKNVLTPRKNDTFAVREIRAAIREHLSKI
ncbi:MAG: hypothetical protein NUV51_03650 [Sulfuricaulis sp.]|nr:hypothetical protein [Sulfuricaulis sp.]